MLPVELNRIHFYCKSLSCSNILVIGMCSIEKMRLCCQFILHTVRCQLKPQSIEPYRIHNVLSLGKWYVFVYETYALYTSYSTSEGVGSGDVSSFC